MASSVDAPTIGSDAGLVVSVIVPVRNGRGELTELLRALDAQTVDRSRFEVIVGDDGSDDGTTRGVESPDGRVRVSAGPPLNAYAARNRAASFARAPILAFVDADCVPEPDWLFAGMSALNDADVVGGAVFLRSTSSPTVWELVSLDSFHDQALAIRHGTGLTGNLFVRQRTFAEVGGFDEELPSGGDFDFVQRAIRSGARLRYASHAVVWHPTFGRGRTLLWRIWLDGRSQAARLAKGGQRPYALRLRWWIPIIPTARARRRLGRPLTLDRSRLTSTNARVRPWRELQALGILYVLIPYLGGAAQIAGWWDGRRR